MKPERLAAIEKATAAIMDGKYHDQFWSIGTRAAPAPRQT